MIEIDHTKEAELPEPEPAKPILASQLLELEEKQRTRFTGNGRSERLTTRCAEIDDLLGGKGVGRGVVVGISADGAGGRLISLNLLATILLSHVTNSPNLAASIHKAKARVVDTTGSFPLSLLAKVLKSQILEARSAAATRSVETANFAVSRQGREGEGSKEFVDTEVQNCLEMVALSRVFDIEGLWEVLGEVESVSSLSSTAEGNPADRPDVWTRKNRVERGQEQPAEIMDSDEETTPIDERAISLPAHGTVQDGGVGNEEHDGVEIIIIDNMTHLINELFARKEKGDAHALLTLLSQTLHTLTRNRNILTLLHNTTVPTNPTYPQPNPQRQPHTPQPTSIFPSNPIKPALGQIFTQFPSLHMFLSSLPKYRSDAEILDGQDEEVRAGTEKVEYCTVVEILKDETPILGSDREKQGNKKREFGWREGRWCAVQVSGDGLRLVGAFEEQGVMDMESVQGRSPPVVKSRVGLGVGNVAKIYGFGGRRV